ncbi:DUF349 domain-containing protein, partial [Halomonas sp. 707D4]|nr:DUF349 domain-containing protein [Halomonas sp. 707D4]
MHALLRRLFAPRWQHPDPKVRRQALDQLDPQHADQRDALKALADDPQPDIQRQALVRLDDLETLVARFARHQDEPAWFDAVRDGLTGRLGQADLRTRRELIERLDHKGLAGEIALNGDNLDIRLAALARLDDENDLIHQACHNGVAGVRQQAAQRVESEQGLKRLLKEARRDRQVARLARDALAKLRHDAEWHDRQAARRDELLVKIEQHANAPWEPLYGGRLRHLEREWRTLDQSPSPEQERRFHQATLRAHKTHSDHETQEQARQARQARRSEADSAREQLLEGLEESIEGLYHAETLTAQDIDSLSAQRRLLGQR